MNRILVGALFALSVLAIGPAAARGGAGGRWIDVWNVEVVEQAGGKGQCRVGLGQGPDRVAWRIEEVGGQLRVIPLPADPFSDPFKAVEKDGGRTLEVQLRDERVVLSLAGPSARGTSVWRNMVCSGKRSFTLTRAPTADPDRGRSLEQVTAGLEGTGPLAVDLRLGNDSVLCRLHPKAGEAAALWIGHLLGTRAWLDRSTGRWLRTPLPPMELGGYDPGKHFTLMWRGPTGPVLPVPPTGTFDGAGTLSLELREEPWAAGQFSRVRITRTGRVSGHVLGTCKQSDIRRVSRHLFPGVSGRVLIYVVRLSSPR